VVFNTSANTNKSDQLRYRKCRLRTGEVHDSSDNAVVVRAVLHGEVLGSLGKVGIVQATAPFSRTSTTIGISLGGNCSQSVSISIENGSSFGGLKLAQKKKRASEVFSTSALSFTYMSI